MKKYWPWVAWLGLTISMVGFLNYQWRGEDRTAFLPGPTTSGHYQIELDCRACHTPWMGVKENACYDCHAAELKLANDSHPKSKFTDPRNADRLQRVKADNCVTCHREHLPVQTRAMGVTTPEDYCYYCHQQTLTDLPSHRDFAFNSCATAGCHNYHDNTALYKDFLLKHAQEPPLKSPALRPVRLLAARGGREQKSLSSADADAPAKAETGLLRNWAASAHARTGVNCSDCHQVTEKQNGSKRWSDQLDQTACVPCHREEVAGFLNGKHGMRLARGLTPMKPSMARLLMKPSAAHQELNCASCHDPHSVETRQAAVEACLQCHGDSHSLAYKQSPHFALWQQELSGSAPAGSGVSCATCHLPREAHEEEGMSRVHVQHNQNLNLRPSEKMIRTVCLDCHGLGFSIDSLADAALVRANFSGQPSQHIESIDLALRRQAKTQKPKSKSNP